jgi:N6-L-threonylcarbamoyladenine synthase
LASQAGIHEQWGGVVPKLAQEAHQKAIDSTVDKALELAKIEPSKLTAVAVTCGPGLGLCLEVGVRKALKIAAEYRIPVIRVHHMEAHALVAKLPKPSTSSSSSEPSKDAESNLAFPFLTVLVSGGHNLTVLTKGLGDHTILGRSLDDSIGEAFDKTARLLGITSIPGGPALEKLAAKGNPDVYPLPKPLTNSKDPVLRTGCDFSFAGLKTSVRTLIERELSEEAKETMEEDDVEEVRANIAAAFQFAAVRHLHERVNRAVRVTLQSNPDIKSMVVAGGVAANKAVRESVLSIAKEHKIELDVPPPRLCVDNGVMIAWCGLLRFALGLWEDPPSSTEASELFVEIRPRWPIGDMHPDHCRPAKKDKFAGGKHNRKGKKRLAEGDLPRTNSKQ